MHVLVGVGLGLAAATKMGLIVGGSAAGGAAVLKASELMLRGWRARKVETKTTETKTETAK